MNEDPKSIWRRQFKPPVNLFIWFVVLLALFLIGFAILAVGAANVNLPYSYGWLLAAGFALLVVLLMGFVRWLGSWRNFKRFLFGLACLVTLIALAYVEEDWRGWHAWNQFKHQWEAKGEKFDFASIIPPSVPDDQNFAMSPVWIAEIKFNFRDNPKRAEAWYGDRIYSQEVSNLVSQLPVSVSGLVGADWWRNPPNMPKETGNWTTARTTDLKPWQTYYRDLGETNLAAHIPVAAQPQSPAADVLLALSKYDPVIEKLRRDSARPYSRFPVGYDDADKAAILLPHLAAVKRCSQVLQLRAIAELQNGQSEKALDDVKLLLRLADSIHTEPFLISHLVRLAILQITLQPVYEGLAEHKWSDEQLVALDSELAKLDLLADYKLSMRGELGFQGGMIEYLRRHTEQFNNITGNDFGDQTASFPARIVGQLIPGSLFSQNRLHCARMMVEFYVPLADLNQQTISPTLTQRADAAVVADTSHWSPYNILERMLLPALGNAVKKFANAQSSLNLARMAIALERYRLAHGEYPESLDALAPQFIAKVPHDIIGGQPSQGSGSASQPLHYRRTSDGQFVLYSVGWNETDDGGVVGLTKGGDVDINKGDWVWRYPAR